MHEEEFLTDEGQTKRQKGLLWRRMGYGQEKEAFGFGQEKEAFGSVGFWRDLFLVHRDKFRTIVLFSVYKKWVQMMDK